MQHNCDMKFCLYVASSGGVKISLNNLSSYEALKIAWGQHDIIRSPFEDKSNKNCI